MVSNTSFTVGSWVCSVVFWLFLRASSVVVCLCLSSRSLLYSLLTSCKISLSSPTSLGIYGNVGFLGGEDEIVIYTSDFF